MTAPADLVLTDATVHTLAEPDRTHEAVAIRDGRVVRLGNTYDVDMLVGADTRRVALDDRVVLPGFVDAHTHLASVGRREIHADLGTAASREEALETLRERAAEIDPDEWVLGYGYDESAWGDRGYLTGDDLDAVPHDGPVVAFREDLHVVSADATALDRLGHPTAETGADGAPAGVLVEGAATEVRERLAPDRAEARKLVAAGQAVAHARGVTAVHDMVRRSATPRAFRDLEREGDLTLRVQLYYWRDHLDAVEELGLATGAGDRVTFGGVKTFSDGSIGARTARLADPYADAPGERGEWVVDPGKLERLAERVDDLDLRLAVHAIGGKAVDATLDAYAGTATPGANRYRIEHAELIDADAIARMADLGVVASVQPNFLKWAGEGGLYDARLGDRRRSTNRLRDLVDAGVPVAFGSDCMPLDPLFGVHHAVNAPEPAQRLEVTEALRAYTRGAAYAGFDEDRLGTVATGTPADLVVLDESPWGVLGAIHDIDVSMTVADGEVVYEDLED